MKWINYVLSFLCFLSLNSFAQRPNFIKKDSIRSKMDDSLQVFFYDKSELSKPQPLVVELHSWSNNSQTQTEILAEQAHKKGWNWIFPNFRGVNNHIKACCSDFVISDIDQTIDWALKNMNIDKNKIYVIGNSGGGYATMAMYMKSKHDIRVFSAWSSISDLAKWYDESVDRKNRYGPEILLCTGANGKIDVQKAWDRSPLFWNVPIKKRRNSFIQIYAGIHDGYTGSVPISHSIDFYNKILYDYKEIDDEKFISETDAETMIATQSFMDNKASKTIDNRIVHYHKATKHASIIIFEGGHEILRNVALNLLGKK
jgi:pimeloyl-ACP methyl ester carboxylesterase